MVQDRDLVIMEIIYGLSNSTIANDPDREGPPEGLWHGAHQELNPALSVVHSRNMSIT